MTFVSGPLVRPVRLDSFEDIAPGVRVAAITATGIDFDADLTPEQVAAIHARMTSRDDTDQAERALIRAARAGAATNLSDIVAARVVGDPLPDPIYPDQQQASPAASVARKRR